VELLPFPHAPTTLSNGHCLSLPVTKIFRLQVLCRLRIRWCWRTKSYACLQKYGWDV